MKLNFALTDCRRLRNYVHLFAILIIGTIVGSRNCGRKRSRQCGEGVGMTGQCRWMFGFIQTNSIQIRLLLIIHLEFQIRSMEATEFTSHICRLRIKMIARLHLPGLNLLIRKSLFMRSKSNFFSLLTFFPTFIIPFRRLHCRVAGRLPLPAPNKIHAVSEQP